jgi:hypothetical protein
MSTTTDTNHHSTASTHRSDANATCPVCRQMRRSADRYRAEYVVTPADGGGWMQWSAALLRLLERTGNEPTRALIIEQPGRTQRYVQMLFGHGTAHVEASSNVYLEGSSRLSGVEERLLSLLGWTAPQSTVDRTDEMPANWMLPLAHGDWVNVVETITATIVGIFGFSEQLPVEMFVFLADRPCNSCSWGDSDDSDEIDETFGTLGF